MVEWNFRVVKGTKTLYNLKCTSGIANAYYLFVKTLANEHKAKIYCNCVKL